MPFLYYPSILIFPSQIKINHIHFALCFSSKQFKSITYISIYVNHIYLYCSDMWGPSEATSVLLIANQNLPNWHSNYRQQKTSPVLTTGFPYLPNTPTAHNSYLLVSCTVSCYPIVIILLKSCWVVVADSLTKLDRTSCRQNCNCSFSRVAQTE